MPVKAPIAWRGGLFLTEGKIVVLSVSSLFLMRVGVYVCVSFFTNYAQYRNPVWKLICLHQTQMLSMMKKQALAFVSLPLPPPLLACCLRFFGMLVPTPAHGK